MWRFLLLALPVLLIDLQAAVGPAYVYLLICPWIIMLFLAFICRLFNLNSKLFQFSLPILFSRIGIQPTYNSSAPDRVVLPACTTRRLSLWAINLPDSYMTAVYLVLNLIHLISRTLLFELDWRNWGLWGLQPVSRLMVRLRAPFNHGFKWIGKYASICIFDLI